MVFHRRCANDMGLMLSETANDKDIQKVNQLLKSGMLQYCKEKKVSSYKNIHSKLTVSDTGLLLQINCVTKISSRERHTHRTLRSLRYDKDKNYSATKNVIQQ